MKTISGVFAWLLAGVIVFWTLGPVVDRPQAGHPFGERFAAFFVLAVCWAFAHPRRQGLVLATVSCGAVLLELAQNLVPGRDARVSDAVEKVAGAICGVMVVISVRAIRRRAALPAPASPAEP